MTSFKEPPTQIPMYPEWVDERPETWAKLRGTYIGA